MYDQMWFKVGFLCVFIILLISMLAFMLKVIFINVKEPFNSLTFSAPV